MIRPPGFRGAAFGTAADGDARKSAAARQQLAARIGIAAEWAYPTQVHGTSVLEVKAAGRLGEADAVYTMRAGLPISVATADCVPVILEGPGVVAVVHAGWRGAAAGVVPAALEAIDRAGCAIERAALGPSIGAGVGLAIAAASLLVCASLGGGAYLALHDEVGNVDFVSGGDGHGSASGAYHGLGNGTAQHG